MKLIIIIFIFYISIANTFAKEKTPIIFGFTHQNFGNLFKFNGVKNSLSKWIIKLSNENNISADVIFYKTDRTLFNAYKNKKINILTINVKGYIEHKKELKKMSDSFWSLSFSENDGVNYCLISNKKDKIKGFKDMKNKTLSIRDEFQINDWFNKKSLEINKKSAKKILKKIIKSQKESTILLNVYFGKINLGVISKNTWLTMNELNPGISKKVTLNECSKISFPPFLGMFRKNILLNYKKKFFSVITNIKKEEDEEKEAIFNIIDLNHFYKISNKNLNEVEKFYKEYEKLKKKYN